MMNTNRGRLIACAGAMSVAAIAGAQDLEVIYSEAPGHPTAVVPGALDLDGMPIVVEFKAMELLSVSPDGSMWIVRGRCHHTTDTETISLLGSGTTGTMFAQEGQPIPGGATGEVYDFFGSGPAHFNTLNHFVYTARARGGVASIFQKGILYNGSYSIVREMGDPALGLLDLAPAPSGDETFGNSFGSIHLLDDGTVGTQDSTVNNIHSSRDPAIFYDDTAFRQCEVQPIGASVWDSFDSNKFYTTPDGSVWMAQGDDLTATSSDDILVRNDVVVVREGDTIASPLKGPSIVVSNILGWQLLPNGQWYLRGNDSSGPDWTMRNGAVLRHTGHPIHIGATENWGDTILAITANTTGSYVIVGNTDIGDASMDQVVVVNNTDVVAREGDPVDLDGNGMFDDDAFIGRATNTSSAFHADDFQLTDDGYLYFYASLRNGAGEDLGEFGTGGDAFIRVLLDLCPADTNGDGEVNVDDLVAVIVAWGTSDIDADINGDGTVNVDDLVAVIVAWGSC